MVTVTRVTIKMAPEPGNKVNLITKWTENGWRRSLNFDSDLIHVHIEQNKIGVCDKLNLVYTSI